MTAYRLFHRRCDMHIPDGFLSGPVAAAAYGVSAVAGGAALVGAKKRFDDRFVPLAGISAAFIFAAQMVNFPIGGGTSGHFLGAMLACLLLGPSVGFWIMTLVLVMQCLLFADGGITALGANVLNMGIVGGIMSYGIFVLIVKALPKGKASFLSATFVVSWLAVVLAAFACSLELGVSGTIQYGVVIPVMTGFHVLIGLGDAIVTTAVLSYMLSARPDLVYAWSGGGGASYGKEVRANG
jgi:cobalt/nickel transport system permease protein